MSRRKIVLRHLTMALAWLVMLASASGAHAGTYPDRAITLVVPFPAGGPTDSVCRIVAEPMQAALGQPVIVENVTGASGSIGVGRVARASPDGYTLSFGNWSTHVVNGAVLPLTYDVRASFEPIALVAESPLLITGRNSLPARDLKELLAWLKANPDKASMGTPGSGSAPHVAGILFQQLTGAQFQFVPYRGVGPATQDLVAERIDLMMDLVANSIPQVRAGKVKAYAVLSKTRLPNLAEIPATGEEGLPELRLSSWQAIWAPRGTPKEVVAKLNAAAMKALADPRAVQRLGQLAQEIPSPDQQSPQALAALQTAEINKWWPIIKAAHIQLN